MASSIIRQMEADYAGPLFEPIAVAPEIAAESKRVFKMVVPQLAILAPVGWLSRFSLQPPRAARAFAPADLLDLAFFVASQENACRHCYGAQRAILKLLGYDERR